MSTPLVQFVEKPDQSSVNLQDSYTNYTIALAITNYVAKGTQLKSFDHAFIRNGVKNASKDDNTRFDRLMSFMIDNGKNTLRYYVDKAQTLFFEEVSDEITSKGKVITITLIVDPIVIILLMVMFIPFILKVQSSLLKIYLHLCQFKESDIMAWLETCNNSAADIKASVTQIRKIYAEENFEVKLAEPVHAPTTMKGQDKVKAMDSPTEKKKEGKEERAGDNGTRETTLHTTKKLVGTKGTENATEEKKNTEEETEQLILTKDEAISERKQKMFSRMTHEKTKTYLIYLFFFAVYIGIFRTADGFVFSSLYGDTDIRTYLYQVISSRSQNYISSMFFLREQLKRNVLLQDFERIFSFVLVKEHKQKIIGGNATSYYVEAAFDAEMKTSRVRAKLTGSLVDLKDFLNMVDTSGYCEYMFVVPADIQSMLRIMESEPQKM